MKQSFYKKSCRWLVMLVAMFAMSMSAMAQDVTIQLKQWNDKSTFQNYATEGVRVTYYQDGMGQSKANIYLANWPLTVTAENGKNIAKVVISNGSALTGVKEKDSKGSMTSSTSVSCTWEAGEGKYTLLTFVSSTDCYAAQIDIWFEEEAPSEPIQYTVLFTGTVPEGCSASYDEDTFTSNDNFEVAKDLKKEDLVINTTPDYYADVNYDEGTHTYNVEFKHWYTYNVVVTGYPTGALVYNGGYYEDGNPEFKSKTVVDENEFSAYPLSRYDATINVESTGDYTYTVTVNYVAYPTLSINAAAASEGNYWTTFSFNKPVSFPEGITPCIVTGEEDGVLTVKEFEGVDSKENVFYDFQNNAVERLGGGLLYIEGDNHDVSMSIQGCSVYQSVNPGQGRLEGAGTVTISHPVNISKVVVTPWGGGYGANVSLNGAVPVNVGNESYTFDVDAPTCTLDLTSNGNGVYIFAIEVVVGGKTLPVIPANTGILLKSEAAASNIQYEVKEAGNVDVTDNLLVAACAPDYNWSDQSKTYYKFSLNGANDEGSVGFYWQVPGGHSLTPTDNKAYLVLSNGSNVRGFRLDGKTDATESIFNALNGEEEAGAVFNLNGQRVNGKPAAGVYVKNGRKFIVK